MNVISSETRMTGLPYGEEIMIVGRTMWTQSTSVTDRQTDIITITNTVQRIASYGKKTFEVYLAHGDADSAVNRHKKTICFFVGIFVDDGLYFDEVVGLVDPDVAAEV